VRRNGRALAFVVVIVAVLACGSTCGTLAVRESAVQVVGNMCTPVPKNPNGYCYEPLPIAGWPFPFLYDSPGTSVLGQLGLEDDFRPQWFLADAAILGALPAAVAVAFLLWRQRRTRRWTA
jgi:hypothetical protein